MAVSMPRRTIHFRRGVRVDQPALAHATGLVVPIEDGATG